jgi:hypothetical protein
MRHHTEIVISAVYTMSAAAFFAWAAFYLLNNFVVI